jgi:hypothetical protein
MRGKSRYAMGWVSDTFNGVPVIYHDGDTGRFTSIMAISRRRWRRSPQWKRLASGPSTDAANGAINLLATRQRATQRPTVTSMLYGRFYCSAQLLFAIKACLRKKRHSVILGYLLPTVINVGLAALFAFVVPRLFLGIPLTELVVSVPDIGLGAIVSLISACLWLALSVKRTARPREVSSLPLRASSKMVERTPRMTDRAFAIAGSCAAAVDQQAPRFGRQRGRRSGRALAGWSVQPRICWPVRVFAQ